MRSYYWHYAKPYTLVQGSQQEITANLNTNIESNDEQACKYIYTSLHNIRFASAKHNRDL